MGAGRRMSGREMVTASYSALADGPVGHAAAALLGSRRVQALGAGLLVAAAAIIMVRPSAGGAQVVQGAEIAAPAAVEPRPLAAAVLAPASGAAVQLFPRLQPNESLSDLLKRVGVSATVAAQAGDLVNDAFPAGVPSGSEVQLWLATGKKTGEPRLERAAIQLSPALRITVGRTRSGELALVREGLAVDATPRRLAGKVGSNLFWSMRAAGVPADAADDAVQALSQRVRLSELRADDRFAIVLDHLRETNGESRAGATLYAGIDRSAGGPVQIVRWSVDGRAGWYDPTNSLQRVEGFAHPVTGKITSRFGNRIHPILRIGRFHAGVDVGAAWGAPVVAAADGIVERAAWNGGHGRQVKVAHSSGIDSSYSHLSGFAVAPGEKVRRGQVIGFVGSTGFSTGAHLHFEVRQDGRLVDPLNFRHSNFAQMSPADLAARRARADQLRLL